ncbi:uncharacterized protein LOC133195894 [Saccostrea echinata]|uniref:uncharacterized protein LOC133195894 n=1 Tax=Saccostrea echinata TaxID=191078 RepID=UPI002A7F477D|nr:uncharacterized protein LOC133195894 [Saccostrea echinata]
MVTRRGSEPCITKDLVLSPTADLDSVMDYADDLGVDMSGLNDVEEMQNRICMHLDYLDSQENPIQTIRKLLIEKQCDDINRRKKLRELLDKFIRTNKSFHRMSTTGKERIEGKTTLESLLETEGITKDLEEDLRLKIQHITHGHCVVVVAGETNAGKTNLLNLLLGRKDLLTVKAISCTSVITRISYGEQLTAHILYESGKAKDITINPDKSVEKQIEELVFERDLDKRENMDAKCMDADAVSEVHLKLPNERLQNGLVLVDSPGIGENPQMDSVIKHFVESNQINGFIYLIKSDSGQRVDEDRIGELLKMILSSQKEKKDGYGLNFDPRLALFVCNHWDNVKKDERDEVFQYIVSRLEKYWPGLQPDQVIKFSAREAMRELDQNENYITSDYKALWGGILELYNSALDKRITSTYKWMETILKRMTHHLKTFVCRLDTSEEDLQKKLSEIEVKLNRIGLHAEEVLQTLTKKIDNACEEIYQSFREHLMTLASKTQIVNWTLAETPSPNEFPTWTEIKMEIYERTSQRISKELVRWEEEQGHIREIERTIMTEIHLKLNLLQEELADVDDDLNSDTRSITSDDTAQSQFGTLRKRQSLSGPSRRSTLHSVMVYTEDTENHLTVPFIAQILSPLGNAMQNIVGNKNRLCDYEKNRTKVARQKSERYYNYLLNTSYGNNFLRNFVEALLVQSRDKLADIQCKIPAIIESDRKVMMHILRCRRDTKVSRELYEEMMTGLEDLKHQLTEYGEGEIFVDDFRNADIRISNSGNSTGEKSIRISNFIDNSSKDSNTSQTGETRALWTILQNGSIRKEKSAEEIRVFIRIYMMSSGVTNITAEVSKLRFLKHNHVAEFLGLHRVNAGFPTLIYKDRMKTIHEYFKSKSKDTAKERVKIFQETVKGLEYLHRRNLVHMELNTHTVTVEQATGMVKLTGACLPRKAILPMERESIQVSHFVFLSPEVLNGETYLACDDSYAAGLLAFELIFRKKPYKEYREWSLDQFARGVKPREMLVVDEVLQGQSEDISALVTKCIGKADDRPRVGEFLNVKFPIVDILQRVDEESKPVPQKQNVIYRR